MRIRIVCYEDVDAWILGKFALKLSGCLNNKGIDTDIAKTPDTKADINHHIIYYNYNGLRTNLDTIMITHIDQQWKTEKVKMQLKNAEMGICMSQSTKKQLIDEGLPKSKLCYINPAHDSVIIPRKLIIGILSKTHADCRKKETLLKDICKRISFLDYKFVIMGMGWQQIVDELRNLNFDIEYYNEFNYDVYKNLVPRLDYFLYFSFDEGSMAFLDALAAGVPTIVTPQGYHLDAKKGITYAIDDKVDSIIRVLNNILQGRNDRINSVKEWTWENYADKHLLVWQYLLQNRNKKFLKMNYKNYNDGISSISPQPFKNRLKKMINN